MRTLHPSASLMGQGWLSIPIKTNDFCWKGCTEWEGGWKRERKTDRLAPSILIVYVPNQSVLDGDASANNHKKQTWESRTEGFIIPKTWPSLWHELNLNPGITEGDNPQVFSYLSQYIPVVVSACFSWHCLLTPHRHNKTSTIMVLTLWK